MDRSASEQSAMEDMLALCRKAAGFAEGKSHEDLASDELLQSGLTRAVEWIVGSGRSA